MRTSSKVITLIGGLLFALSLLAACGPGSLDTSSVQQKWLDVPYATLSSAQKLDIYLPNQGQEPFPVVVVIHGGGFALGDKAGGDLASQFEPVNHGYAVVSINYRLSGEALFPAQIQDVKAAIRFIRANAAQYKLNPDKIAVWGASAGGNLAALAGVTGDVAELEDLSLGNPSQSSRVQAVVDWFGPVNFLTMDEQNKASGLADKVSGVQTHDTADSFESKLVGKQISLAPELVKAANPETYITADDPPFFIQHGTLDPNVPTQQSVDFAAALTSVIGADQVTLELLEGAGHGGAQFDAADNVQKVLDFLDKALK